MCSSGTTTTGTCGIRLESGIRDCLSPRETSAPAQRCIVFCTPRMAGAHTPHVSHRSSLSFACRYGRSIAEVATAPAQHPACPPRRWAVTTVHPVGYWSALPVYLSGAPDASGKAPAMARIYLSSTYSDLEPYREAVYRTLRKMEHDVRAMEDYVAQDQRPVDKCLADVAACEVYVGIFAWRYGSIPPTAKPEQRSITEMEYREASTRNTSLLIFLLGDQAPWNGSLQAHSLTKG